MANHPRLPLEVVEQIIDIVGAKSKIYKRLEDLPSVKACALVCHSFLALCRKHIFASVTLNDLKRRSPSPTSDDFYHLLSNSPHLAVYIRELEYIVNKEEFVAKRLPWLSSMFKKLVKLQVLSINKWGFNLGPGNKLDWMSSSERKVLLPLLHLPTLTSISLFQIRNFTLADLAGCANLKTLEFWELECSTGVGKFLEVLPTTPVMLECLVMDDGNLEPVHQLRHARRPDGKPIIDFSSLKEILATVTRLDSLTEFFEMCRNLRTIDLTSVSPTHILSLHPSDVTLVVQQADPYHDPWEPISTLKGLFTMLKPSLPTLVNIKIEYHIDCDYDETSDGPLAGLCHELEKMVGQNVVETIDLVIWVLSGCYDCTRWGELDDILMGSSESWPALRKVSLWFKVTTILNDDDDKALRELSMTKLVESKRVQFGYRMIECSPRDVVP